MNQRLYRVKKIALGIVCLPILLQAPSCQEIVFTNAVAGLRDGLIEAVSGVIEDTFNSRFELEEEDEGEAESGDDLFIKP